jgi:hypothetical protein
MSQLIKSTLKKDTSVTILLSLDINNENTPTEPISQDA